MCDRPSDVVIKLKRVLNSKKISATDVILRNGMSLISFYVLTSLNIT